MKNLNILIVLFLSICIFGCEEEFEPINEFSDVMWMDLMRDNGGQLAIDDYMSFADLSQGTVSHTWSFSDTSGIMFLEGNMTRSDKDYTEFIAEIQDTITSKETVHLLFTKPGFQKVRLYNEFRDSVAFRGNDTVPAVYNPAKNVWVMDTTFTVEIFDSIQPAIQVFYNDEVVMNLTEEEFVNIADKEDWPVYTIQSGESLKFVDNTVVGQPTDRTWAFEGGAPGNSSNTEANVFYYKLGDYLSTINLSRTGEMPAGSKKTYLPLVVRVKKSELPFEMVGTPVEQSDETIQITVNGELQPFAGEEDNFTVMVSNTEAGLTEKKITVKTAKVHETLKNVIELTLSEKIYSSDDIKVSWDSGSIMSLDERVLTPITVVNAKMNIVNLCEDMSVYGFENNTLGSAANDQNYWSIPSNNKGTITISDEMAYEGTYSLKMEAQGNDAAAWAWIDSPINGLTMEEGKTYTVSFMYNVATSNAVATTNGWLGLLPWSNSKSFSYSPSPTGNWEKVSYTVNYNVASALRNIRTRFGNDGTGTPVVAYFDNYSIVEVEIRPTE